MPLYGFTTCKRWKEVRRPADVVDAPSRSAAMTAIAARYSDDCPLVAKAWRLDAPTRVFNVPLGERGKPCPAE